MARKGMEKVEIYRFQLESIKDALRMTANIHKSRTPKPDQTCFDRTVVQAERYAANALDGKIDERVPYIKTWQEKE